MPRESGWRRWVRISSGEVLTLNDGRKRIIWRWVLGCYQVLGKNRLKVRVRRFPDLWENGYIERFFGSFKSALRKITLTSATDLIQAADEFRFFYNRIRLPQNLGYRTPIMAWRGQNQFPKMQTLRWFSSWGGELCGWYWGEPDD